MQLKGLITEEMGGSIGLVLSSVLGQLTGTSQCFSRLLSLSLYEEGSDCVPKSAIHLAVRANVLTYQRNGLTLARERRFS